MHPYDQAMPTNEWQKEQAKPGPLMTAAGAKDATAGLTLDATPRLCGPLPDGAYTIEAPDADCYYVIGGTDVLTKSPTFAAVHGVLLRTGIQDYFNTDGKANHIGYVIKSGSSTDGLRVNIRSEGR